MCAQTSCGLNQLLITLDISCLLDAIQREDVPHRGNCYCYRSVVCTFQTTCVTARKTSVCSLFDSIEILVIIIM